MDAGLHKLKLDICEFWWDRIGEKGRRTVEEKTNCQMKKVEEGYEISGTNEEEILSAKKQMEQKIKNARKKIDHTTHLVTLSAVTPETTENFNKFKNRVLETTPIPEDAFFWPERLHWTLAKLVLKGDQEIENAIKHFEGLKDVVMSVLDGGELRVKIKAIDFASEKGRDPDPKQVKVLFALSDSELLSKLQWKTSKYMKKIGYSWDLTKTRPPSAVVLMRSSYLEDKLPFDAQQILEDLKDFEFGTVTPHTMHLSETGADRDNCYYPSIASFDF